MSTCRQSTEWVIKKEKNKLSVKENLQLLSHMAICSFCRLFARQNTLINKSILKNERMEALLLTSKDKKELIRSVHNKIRG
ncbi:MAG TPA: hypothetical protein VGP43_00430 [Chitinophagaceae bacterium]|nr:hypothetical protein [Chitinophagaceae bacterium]